MNKSPKTLRLILGDQLNRNHSWYTTIDDSTTYLIMEMRQETDYVKHHVQKVVGFFSAMREMKNDLVKGGHQVRYVTLDDQNNSQDLKENLDRIILDLGIEKFEYQLPDEYRLDQMLMEICNQLSIPTCTFDTEHFLTERDELESMFVGKKTYLMETFYRAMRKKHNVMMDGDQPITGQWNYDAENRKKIPTNHVPPAPHFSDRDVTDIVELLDTSGVETIGKIDRKHFLWPVNREESLAVLRYFTDHLLQHFGDFQDAMTPHYWSLYHSRISFSLNSKILSPKEVIDAVIKAWQRNDQISISQVEGFVRQILGWREYMRGIYWAHMPSFADKNYLEHTRDLPRWYWNGNTKMRCVSHAINQSLEYAYAHHIQRLMITGNFALLAGIHPDQVDEWYLGIYIDAIEWVEITNTRGMSQFADGGIVGTKPYVSSANYIHKMSHYCKDCYYDNKVKVGPRACPFNSLYWNFYDRHEAKLKKNPRIGMAYRLWDRMDSDSKADLLNQAKEYLDNINTL